MTAHLIPSRSDVAEAYDAVAGTYDTTYLGPKDIAENRYVVRRLIDGGHLCGQVLDAGCGTGFLLDEVPNMDWRAYTGLDISPGMVQRAGEKHPRHRFLVGDMADMRSLPDESFESVICLFESFNYSHRPRSILAEMWRVLRVGGMLLVMSGTSRLRTRGLHVLGRNLDEISRMFYAPRQLKNMAHERFADVKVRGMSCLAFYLPARLPQKVHDLWIRAEAATVGIVAPSVCFYLILTGRKEET